MRQVMSTGSYKISEDDALAVRDVALGVVVATVYTLVSFLVFGGSFLDGTAGTMPFLAWLVFGTMFVGGVSAEVLKTDDEGLFLIGFFVGLGLGAYLSGLFSGFFTNTPSALSLLLF